MTAPALDYSFLPPVLPRSFRLYPGEKAVWRAQPEQTCSQWAQGERHVEISPFPGPWDNDIAPYLVGLMDLYSQEYVREMYLCGGSQSAKTDFMQTCWGYNAIHRPGPSLIVMQDRLTGSETISDRLIPMIHKTPSLRKLKTHDPDDISLRRIRLRTGQRTYLGWANSEGRLASKPCENGYFDEVDLWPESAHRKAHARFRAFENSYKIIEACTASSAGGRIWIAQKQAQLVIDFYPVCPYCDQDHAMTFANIRYGDGIIDPADLGDKGSAWYVCPHCEARWDEEDRDEAVRTARQRHDGVTIWHGWRARDGGAPFTRAARIWAHIPPLVSRFVPFHKIAAAYLTTLSEPSLANLAYFYNDCLGLPVPEDSSGEMVQESVLYQRRVDYAPAPCAWSIPMAGVFLVADFDVQGNRLEGEVVAWGPGHQSWGIEYKVFHGDTEQDEVWNQLHDWAQKITYAHESGATLRLSRLGIDIGYRTTTVGKFVKRSRLYLAHKGSNNHNAPMVPRKPSKTRKDPVPFYEIGVDAGKDKLMSWLSIESPGPRYCHWHKGYDYEYFRMLCAERPRREKNKKTGKIEIVWSLREGIIRNEALDIRVGNLCVMTLCNPNYEKLAAEIAAIAARPVETVIVPKKKAFTQSKGVTLD